MAQYRALLAHAYDVYMALTSGLGLGGLGRAPAGSGVTSSGALDRKQAEAGTERFNAAFLRWKQKTGKTTATLSEVYEEMKHGV
jgi:hypothetical protein